jgi:hypothetical protein
VALSQNSIARWIGRPRKLELPGEDEVNSWSAGSHRTASLNPNLSNGFRVYRVLTNHYNSPLVVNPTDARIVG